VNRLELFERAFRDTGWRLVQVDEDRPGTSYRFRALIELDDVALEAARFEQSQLARLVIPDRISRAYAAVSKARLIGPYRWRKAAL